jgi:hypothetical protein
VAIVYITSAWTEFGEVRSSAAPLGIIAENGFLNYCVRFKTKLAAWAKSVSILHTRTRTILIKHTYIYYILRCADGAGLLYNIITPDYTARTILSLSRAANTSSYPNRVLETYNGRCVYIYMCIYIYIGSRWRSLTKRKKKSPTYVAVVIRKLNYAAATTVNNNSIFAMSFDVTAVVTTEYQTETQ